MLDRIRGQQEYEIAVMRELDPYFQFQARIQHKLENIYEDKSKRTKTQELKLKQLKLQIANKKLSMTNNFRAKCQELGALEQDNRMMKQMIINKSDSNINEKSSKMDMVSNRSFIQKRDFLPTAHSLEKDKLAPIESPNRMRMTVQIDNS